MCSDEGFEAGIGLGVGDLPREPAKDHAQKDNSHGPDIGLAWVIGLVAEHLGRKVGIATNDARCRGVRFAWVVEYGGGTKIDELDGIAFSHDAVVKFQVAVGKAHFVKIFNTIADLPEDTVDLRSTHFSRHDDGKEVEWSELHDLRL